MQIAKLLFGLATFVPGINPFRWKTTGGSCDPEYCYSVWLRHLSRLRELGLETQPQTVAEIGPGDSLGLGLMALLTGSARYIALDVVRYADLEQNRQVLRALVEMLRARNDIPGPEAFPGVKPALESYAFPHDILTAERLEGALAPERIDEIDAALTTGGLGSGLVTYKVPWISQEAIEAGTIDMIYSQAVLEHVDDLAQAYGAMSVWLRPGGIISHQIDFKCHGTTDEWNGHWVVKDWLWTVLKGRLPYLLNREPWSVHKRLVQEAGVRVMDEQVFRKDSVYNRQDLNPRFSHVTDDDLSVAGVHMVGVGESM